MKLSDGVEWGLHCCTLLALLPDDAALPASRLAEFHGVPAAYLAKHLQALSRAGIVEAVAGARGGYRLARPAAEVTLLDVVEAVEGRTPAFRCTEIRQQGPLPASGKACRRPCGIARAMYAAEDAYRASLGAVTIADLAAGVQEDAGPRVFDRVRGWLADA